MNDKLKQQEQLRLDAEAKLATKQISGEPAQTAEQLLHELRVHQIELEMQNEDCAVPSWHSRMSVIAMSICMSSPRSATSPCRTSRLSSPSI